MMINKEYKRLKSVKNIYRLIIPVTCSCCKNEFVREKVYRVDRWGANKTINSWYYCKRCMHTKEKVLSEIDSDECIFGIAFIDDFWKWEKKDKSRMNIEMQKILNM